jgi:hypothetical protein
MIDTGKEDAATIVATTKPGESFKKLDDWVDSAKLKAENLILLTMCLPDNSYFPLHRKKPIIKFFHMMRLGL